MPTLDHVRLSHRRVRDDDPVPSSLDIQLSAPGCSHCHRTFNRAGIDGSLYEHHELLCALIVTAHATRRHTLVCQPLLLNRLPKRPGSFAAGFGQRFGLRSASLLHQIAPYYCI